MKAIQNEQGGEEAGLESRVFDLVHEPAALADALVLVAVSVGSSASAAFSNSCFPNAASMASHTVLTYLISSSSRTFLGRSDSTSLRFRWAAAPCGCGARGRRELFANATHRHHNTAKRHLARHGRYGEMGVLVNRLSTSAHVIATPPTVRPWNRARRQMQVDVVLGEFRVARVHDAQLERIALTRTAPTLPTRGSHRPASPSASGSHFPAAAAATQCANASRTDPW